MGDKNMSWLSSYQTRFGSKCCNLSNWICCFKLSLAKFESTSTVEVFIYFLFWWGRQWKHDTNVWGHKFKTLSLSWGESACGRKSEQEETKLIGYEEAKWGYPQYLASNLAFEWCSHCGQQWEGTMNSGDGNVGAKRLIFLGWPELRNSLRAWQVAASQTVDWHVSKSLLLSINVFSLALLMSSVKGQQWDSQAEFL